MATLRRYKKATVNEDSQDETPMSNLSQDTNICRVKEDYIILVSEEIEGEWL